MTKSKIQNKSKIQIPKSKTKYVLLFVICALTLFCHLCFGICRLSFAQDKIVAIVNNDCITQKDLNDFSNFMRMQLSQDLKGEKLENEIQTMKSDLLNRLIDDRLILQEAKRDNVAIDENRVKAKIGEIKKHYASDGEFQLALGQQGLTQADLETKIREQLVMYTIIGGKVRSKIAIKPSEVTDFYQKNIENFKTPEERQITSIKLSDEKLADTVYKSLKEGGDLNNLVNKYTLTINKITVARNEELKKEIEGAIFKLNVNEISSPIKIEDSLYIFILDSINSARQQNLSEAQDKIYNLLFNRKMQEELTKWLDGIKKQSYIKIFTD